MCGGRPSPPPPPAPVVIDNTAELRRQQEENNQRIAAMEAKSAQQRAEDIARIDKQYKESQAIQQQQFNESMAAQQKALDAQLAAQRAAQAKAEEMTLRSQVPEMTANSKNAARVKPRASARQQTRQASMGTSQLRVPLGIGGSGGMSAGGSPVKLNIGS